MLHTLILTGHVSRSMRDPEAEMVELEHLFSPQKIKDLLKANLGARIKGALVREILDSPSSFFFSSDRKSGLTDPGQIRKRAMRFYTSL